MYQMDSQSRLNITLRSIGLGLFETTQDLYMTMGQVAVDMRLTLRQKWVA
jgi:hypothetical protein